jgi:RimJ/RimL family protein N-acetyltransferase
MKTTIYGQDNRVADFVTSQVDDLEFFGKINTLGVEQDGELIAGVVFENYTGSSISMHVAALDGRNWLSKEFLFRVFAYPFLQLECNRVTGLVRTDNAKAQRFDEHIGFIKEGVLRKGATDGTDYIIYGMLKEECRWLNFKVKEAKNG